jgi:hypothetical protein
VRVECCRAVRTYDPKVLESVVIPHAIDVVEDQADPLAMPVLVLTAQLAASFFQLLVVEPLLQVAPAIGRPLDKDLLQPLARSTL